MGWRRRYCPRPVFVVLAVAVCIFYQCVTLFWKNASWTLEEYGSETQEVFVDETTKGKNCLNPWTSLYRRVNEFGNKTKKSLISRSKKNVFLFVHPSIGTEEYNLYRRILTKLGCIVLSADIMTAKTERKEELQQGMLNYRDILIYIPSNESVYTNCKEKRELLESFKMKKVNLLPEIQQLVCENKTICDRAGISPELQNLSICSSQFGESSAKREFSSVLLTSRGREKTQHAATQGTSWKFKPLFNLRSDQPHQFQDLPLIRTYVLVTSLSPLRAFIHSIGIVQSQPNQQFVPIKLRVFFKEFFKRNYGSQAFNDIKETIGEYLLTFEGRALAWANPLWEAAKPCTKNFSEFLRAASAAKRLLEIQQGSCTVAEYTIEFRTLAAEVSWNDEVLVAAFAQGLCDRIKDETATRDLPNNLDEFIDYSILIDSRIRERMAAKDRRQRARELGRVKEHFQFEGLNSKDQITKEIILEDAFKFILQSIPFSLSDVLNKLRKFSSMKIYPSISSKLEALKNELYSQLDSRHKVGSIPHNHVLLSHLLKDFYSMRNDVSKFSSTMSNTFQEKTQGQFSFPEVSASVKDDDTLSYISRIFSNPQLDLSPAFNPKIKDYYAEVPFDVVTVEIGAEAVNSKTQVHLDNKEGQSVRTYPLGLGQNQITIFVTDETTPYPVLLRSYRITVHREDRPSMPLFDHYKMCGFVQDCGLIIRTEESCGLQPVSSESMSSLSQARERKCESGAVKGQWIVPCLSCSDNRTCDWRAISWRPSNCHHPILSRDELQQCVSGRKILFIGDSTNRGIMYYLIEQVNETLQEWQKSHGMKFYNNINNGKTQITYSYYPRFWIEATKRPSFEHALEQLIERSRPLKNTKQTVLVVGGVQWLNSNHLQIIDRVLKRENLSDILIIVKSIGMGFHLPVHGIRSLSPSQVKHLYHENMLILTTAKLYGFEVVDTFSITMGRYKEFLQGKCGCHFHEVVNSKGYYQRKMKLLKSYTFGGESFPQIRDHSSNMKSPYHVQGPVNQVYSEILLSRMCV
ncbi:cadherin-like and PC-esterase domain-containing protein 1 [Rhinophrynus dorsalis]